MNAVNTAEMNILKARNVEELGDFLFSVLEDGTCMFEQMDELVIDIEG